MNQKTLNAILVNHDKWVCDPTTGAKANLAGADLTGADLPRANLTGADWTEDDDEYNGGCCAKDEEANFAEQEDGA